MTEQNFRSIRDLLTPAALRALRTNLRLTQTALAGRLGMTRDAIAAMESGRRPITRVTELALEHLSCRKRKKVNNQY